MARRCDVLYGMMEVKMVRIDHSDIYLENGRLNEALSHSLDKISRHKYRHVMAREAEIRKLKQSSRHLFEGASEINEQNQRQNNNSITRSKSAGVLAQPQQTTNQGVSTQKRMRSLSVKLPQENDNDSDSNDDDDDDNDDDDDEDNREIAHRQRSIGFADKSDSDSDMEDSSGPFGRSASQSRPPQMRKNVQRAVGDNWMENSIRPSGHGMTGETREASRLDLLMDRLKLEKFPPHWYTTVVEAAESNDSRRGGAKQCRSNLSVPMFPRRGKGRRGRPKTSTATSRESQSQQGSRGRSSQSLPPSARTQSALVCGSTSMFKTRRELFANGLDDSEDSRKKKGISRKLQINRQNSRSIQGRVNEFVKTLDELEKAKRLREGLVLERF